MRSDLIITRIPAHTKEWHEFRTNGIGGSEISTVLGLNPYNTVTRTFYEKIKAIAPQDFDNPKMFFGRYMEDKIADLWEFYDGSELGWIDNYKNNKIIRKCRKINGYVVNPDYPWLFASLDRVQNVSGGINLLTGEKLTTEAVLEVKTLSYWSSQQWADGLPVSFLLQVHQYMIVIESDYAEISILKDGNTLQIEKIQRDESLCQRIIDISKSFWYNRVLPAKEYQAKKQEAERQGNISQVEYWESKIQELEPAPDTTEAYRDFQSEKFLKERDSIEGTMHLYDLCKQDKVLIGVKNLIDEARMGISNTLVKELTLAGAEEINFGRLGNCTFSERKGSKNRVFSNKIKEKPSEDQLLEEFKKINLECY